MKILLKWLGSIKLAVPLLIAIAGVLAWGTIYESRYGTASVQRDVYTALWFQLILGFLAVNLALAAFQRYPWKPRHAPFLLAHLGIILILTGGIIGGISGVDGQLIIPEGQANKTLQLFKSELAVSVPDAEPQVVPTRFESRAWVQNPNTVYPVQVGGRSVTLTVDQYFPDAAEEESVDNSNAEPNPAVHLLLRHPPQEESLWLFSRDQERFGAGWGKGQIFFMEPKSESELRDLIEARDHDPKSRGTLFLQLPGETEPRPVAVPAAFSAEPVRVGDTPYTLTFKDYFADFALDKSGPISRSDEPNNPAVAFLLSGPEGSDAHLLFAFHPDFASIHGRKQTIPAQVVYRHPAGAQLPTDAFAILRSPSGELIGLITGSANEARQVIRPLEIGKAYAHESLGVEVTIAESLENAKLARTLTNRSREVKAEALHVVAKEGEKSAEAWLFSDQPAEMDLGGAPLRVEYRRGRRDLPVTIKLTDFRKIEYPGIQMAAGFESDVQLTDTERGTILLRKISMNKPLRYRGYSFFQSSFIDGEPQTTVLSVRKDPGTLFVYAGFIIVIAGVVLLFVSRARATQAAMQKRVMA